MEFKDDEKTIKLLDKLVWIEYPDTYRKMHVVKKHSEDFTIVPKYSWYGQHSDKENFAKSVKEVFDIIREKTIL